MGSIDEIVAVNIHLRMEQLRMSQLTLAVLTGLSKDHINKLLKGKKPLSKSTSLPKIAKALHMEEVELYQDPQIKALAEAKEIGAAAHAADLKRMNRMLAEQVGELLNERKSMAFVSDEERELIALFRNIPVERQGPVLELVKTYARGGAVGNKAKPAPSKRARK